MEFFLSFEFAIIFLALVQVALLGIFGIGVYMLAKNPNDLNTAEYDAFLDRLQENQEILEGDTKKLFKQGQEQQVTIDSLQSRFAELHEFVNRGIQRMSARNQRAEELLKFHEDLDELSQVNGNQQQMDFNEVDPNAQGKLVRAPR